MTNQRSESVRINKYLAACGVCSRRDGDRMVAEGKVLVNGQPAAMGTRVFPGDTVEVNGKVLQGQNKKAVLAFYKPVGITCSERDPHAEKLILDMIHYPVRVTYAGRLDRDSEGLILLTNDGGLIDAMMRGANGHEKEYIVKVNREITGDFLEQMGTGVYLKELNQITRSCQVEQMGRYTFRMILTQGLNRQIRRMCKCLGYEVMGLKRVRVMNVQLGNLKPGDFRELSGQELEQLYAACGMRRE